MNHKFLVMKESDNWHYVDVEDLKKDMIVKILDENNEYVKGMYSEYFKVLEDTIVQEDGSLRLNLAMLDENLNEPDEDVFAQDLTSKM